MKRIIPILIVTILLLNGCGHSSDLVTEATGDPIAATIPTPADMFTDRDLRVEPKNEAYTITLADSGISSDCSSLSISGSTATITEEADYRISGSLSDGMIIVDTDKEAKLHLIFSNVAIHNNASAALYIKQADKVVVTLEGENTLSGGDSLLPIDENEMDAVLYSKDDLTINGSGTLNVTAPAGRGISAKDDLVLAGGTYEITCSDHAIDANDSIRAKDSTISIAAGKDGLHAENNEDSQLGFVYLENSNLNITAEGDGISGGSYVHIQSGNIEILAGGGSINAQQKTSSDFGGFGGGKGPGGPGGMRPGGRYASAGTSSTEEAASIKGIKAGTDLLIADGVFQINAADDTLHANNCVTITGGDFSLSSGDDGIHADDTLSISNGTINVTESYEGLEGLHIQITGGIITLICSDDGINAAGGTDSSGFGGIRGDRFGGGMNGSSNGSVEIHGGTIYMNASGDGIDSNGYLTIAGGQTIVCGPTTGDTAVLDYDTTAQITGGTFIGTGASMMAQSFTSSTQGVIALSVGNQVAGTGISVKDENGNILISEEPKLNYQILIVSCPEMAKGESYTVCIGSYCEKFTAN